jgi:hypothetical protein
MYVAHARKRYVVLTRRGGQGSQTVRGWVVSGVERWMVIREIFVSCEDY